MRKKIILIAVVGGSMITAILYLPALTPHKYPKPTPISPTPISSMIPKKQTVSASKIESGANYLTDEKGMTLYFSLDECTGKCLENWQPYWADQDANIKSNVSPYNKINIFRVGEKYQYGYGLKLLYYYKGDTKPGDRKGDGIDNWYLVLIR